MTLFELIICSKACDFLTELLKLLNDVHMTQSLLGGLLLNTEHLSGPRTTDNLRVLREVETSPENAFSIFQTEISFLFSILSRVRPRSCSASSGTWPFSRPRRDGSGTAHHDIPMICIRTPLPLPTQQGFGTDLFAKAIAGGRRETLALARAAAAAVAPRPLGKRCCAPARLLAGIKSAANLRNALFVPATRRLRLHRPARPRSSRSQHCSKMVVAGGDFAYGSVSLPIHALPSSSPKSKRRAVAGAMIIALVALCAVICTLFVSRMDSDHSLQQHAFNPMIGDLATAKARLASPQDAVPLPPGPFINHNSSTLSM